LREEGTNELDPPKRTSLLAAIVDASTEPFVILLAIAGAIAVALGEIRDGLLVLVGLLPIIGADVVIAYRGDRALEALRDAGAPRATVRRDGRIDEVPARDLVRGDIVLLRAGDVVPADLRLIRADTLQVDRSVLTGESLPEPASPIPDPLDAAMPDRRSMAYSGTAVILGRGEGIVVATGPDTEVGRIAGAIGPTDRGRSPLQRELDRLVRILLVAAIALIGITTGLALIRQATIGEALLAGISAAIAAIPEEPPVLLAVVLGFGAYRLLRQRVLVRRLNAQETLGAVDLIVTDKTGTLTENRLVLAAVLTASGPVDDGPERRALVTEAIRAEDDAWHRGTGHAVGSFTRSMLDVVGEDEGLGALDPADLLAAQVPGDGQPLSLTRSRRDGRVEERALGAPEAVLALADGDHMGEGLTKWHELVSESAAAGRRLLLLAGREDDRPWRPKALLAFSDRLRPGVAEALRTATGAGIQTIVVTGDHPATAATIAREANLPAGGVVTGAELAAMSDEAVGAALAGLSIVARATPDQKRRLVAVALDRDRTVAVTGDGVNDAPALGAADVGVAMGSGTSVAREAADLVLGDDSFATLIGGLAEGRRIVANVQKGLVFLTSTHVALLGFILVATLGGVTQPLLPIQILWLELFIDLATSVAFEREPPEPGYMDRPPRPRSVPLLTRELLWRVTAAGGFTGAAAFAVMLTHGGGADHARWLAFNILVISQVVRAYANRSLEIPVWRMGPNGFLAAACLAVVIIQVAIPYVPALREIFRATPLDALDVAIVAVVAFVPAIVAQVARSLGRTPWVA
jgi:Ca2+-transporting ATPase